jgi:hypothetical protein
MVTWNSIGRNFIVALTFVAQFCPFTKIQCNRYIEHIRNTKLGANITKITIKFLKRNFTNRNLGMIIIPENVYYNFSISIYSPRENTYPN